MIAEDDTHAETVTEAVEARNEPPKAAKAVEDKQTVSKPVQKAATKVRRKAKPVRSKAQPRAQKRNDDMKTNTNDIFAGFGAFPGFSGFEKLFADATQRGEEAVKRSRKAAEQFAEIYRGNIDAFVEAGRIAASGAQSIGQDVVSKSRDSLEQTANTVRSFAEAKSPTELLQLQSDFARTAFDRFVEESSTLTESVVKLAGEAIQPISNRASSNVEKLNTIAA